MEEETDRSVLIRTVGNKTASSFDFIDREDGN